MLFVQKIHVHLVWTHFHLIDINNNQGFLIHACEFPRHVTAIPPSVQAPLPVGGGAFESVPGHWTQRRA